MPLSPEAVIAGQLDAYNAKDIDTFLTFWAPNAQIFEHPAALMATGHAEIRARHEIRFQEPDLAANLLHRAVLGSKVIDHERVTRNFPEGLGTIEVGAVYEVKDGLIEKAWFVFGEKALR